jgi:hypothetical protein
MRAPMLILAAATTALLASCGEKAAKVPDTGPQTAEAVKAEVSKVKLKPGQWQGSFEIEQLDMAGVPGGMPEQAKEQMKRAMAKNDMKYCVTPEEAENPDGAMFSGQRSKDCTYSGFDASSGKLTGKIMCKNAGGTMTAVMSGTYGSESYEMLMDMKNEGGPQGASMTMKARTSGKWIGKDCA